LYVTKATLATIRTINPVMTVIKHALWKLLITPHPEGVSLMENLSMVVNTR
jgi:hypothetical protein